MKRYLIFALVAALTFSLAGCGQTEPTPGAEFQEPATAIPPGAIGQTPPASTAEYSSLAVRQAPADATPAGVTIRNGITLTGRVQWEGLASLFGPRSHSLQRNVDRVSALTLSGGLLGTQSNSESFEFQVPPEAAYLLKVRTMDGVNLWALTPRLTGDAIQNVSLETTYEVGLIYAAEREGAITSDSAATLKDSAGLALLVGADRLVNTVKRVLNNALFWGVDYSIFTELNESNLRAFGGGLEPFRSLDSLTTDPQPDYVPHIFMLNTSGSGPLFLDRILMSELKADRWTAIVVAEDIPPRVYRGLGGLDVAQGGTELVYGEDKCFRWDGDQCQTSAEREGAITSDSAATLKDSAGLALLVGADRLVNTVKRVLNNALFWGVDYSIFTELNESNLRAFGGGLEPFRSLDSLTTDPQPDYVPHIFMLNTSGSGPLFLDRILMSELKADRWTAIVVAEDIPPRVYRGLGGLDVAQGGTELVYGEDKCFRWDGDQCQIFRQVLVTYPLDPPPGITPTEITSVEEFDGAHRPQWSWDQRKIAFHAYPSGRLDRAQIYVVSSDGSVLTRLTSESQGQNGATAPSWSPGNSRIVYVSDEKSFSWDIWVMNSDGSGQENLTNGRVKFPNEPKFSPDSRRILFYAQDRSSSQPRRGGPDNELWVMNRDGTGLRKVTDNEVDDENPVWGLNGVDVVYSVDEESWEASNVFTGEKLFEFPGITRGRYVSPVLASTPHVLIPTQAAIEAQQVSEQGYVDERWLAEKVEANEETAGYRVATPSNDPLTEFRYEIFTAFTQTPIYQSDVGGWIPPVISWP